MDMRNGYFYVLFVVLVLVSCSPITKEIMNLVDEVVPFDTIQKSTASYRDKTVLWGGVIISTKNEKDETVITVLHTDLDVQKRPTNHDRSQGRFLVRTSGFLDPVIYEKGREITVVGRITGTEERPLGDDSTYVYPVIAAKEIYLWQKRMVSRDSDYPYWYTYPYWWDRYPFWRDRIYHW